MFPHIQSTVNTIESNPEVGSAVSFGIMAAGHAFNLIQDGRINPLIMDTAQLGVWLVGASVGVISVFGFIRKIVLWVKSRNKKTTT